MANPEHLAKLEEGVEAWNKWRIENPDVKPDLSEFNFMERDISDYDLTACNLTGADLRNTEVWGGHLSNANLWEADLREANLLEANLSGADLSKADLRGINPQFVPGGTVSPFNTNLRKARLYEAKISKADLTGADLTGADLRHADLRHADLSEADLTGADLTGANLSEANLTGADLSEANLTGANLSSADLSKATLCKAYVENNPYQGEANLSEANLSEADLSKADLSKADLSKADLSKADLSLANLGGANLSGADLSEANLSWANLGEANLSGANLGGANLRGAYLPDAKLHGASIVDANLQGTNVAWSEADGSTVILGCDVDRYREGEVYTNFEGVGLGDIRIEPATRQLLEYNIRRVNWNRWYQGKAPYFMPPLEGRRKWLQLTWTWPVRWFWGLSDYGASTKRIIFWFFALSLVFAAVYASLAYWVPPGAVHDLAPENQGSLLHYVVLVIVRPIYFSVVTMTTLGFGDMHAEKGSILGHILLTLQVLLGYVMLGALVTRFAVMFTGGGPAGKFAPTQKPPKPQEPKEKPPQMYPLWQIMAYFWL